MAQGEGKGRSSEEEADIDKKIPSADRTGVGVIEHDYHQHPNHQRAAPTPQEGGKVSADGKILPRRICYTWEKEQLKMFPHTFVDGAEQSGKSRTTRNGIDKVKSRASKGYNDKAPQVAFE